MIRSEKSLTDMVVLAFDSESGADPTASENHSQFSIYGTRSKTQRSLRLNHEAAQPGKTYDPRKQGSTVPLFFL